MDQLNGVFRWRALEQINMQICLLILQHVQFMQIGKLI